MRRLLAALSLIASASLAHAGVLVELTDGTKLTVESHWNDGDQVHLVRGGVDMIVAKSRIKSMDDTVKDPEVFSGSRDARADSEAAKADAPGPSDAPAAGAEAAVAPAAADPQLSDMSAEELEALQQQESDRMQEMNDKRWQATYGGTATPQQVKAAEDAYFKQNRRTAQVTGALKTAQQAEGGVPTVPRVEQPQ
jgi:hypothetical protein